MLFTTILYELCQPEETLAGRKIQIMLFEMLYLVQHYLHQRIEQASKARD